MSLLDKVNQQANQSGAGTTTTGVQAAEPTSLMTGNAAAASGGMSLEDILGISADDASLMEGTGLWPAGKWIFKLTEIETDTYEIRSEEHPRVGQDAQLIRFVLTCMEGMAGTAKDGDGKSLNAQQVSEYVGKEFKEAVMFGNDGLPNPKKPEEIKYSGRDKIFTLIHHFIGEEAYEALKASTGGTLGGMLQAIGTEQPMFACEVTHNINPNDPNKRKNHQLNLFGEFIPIKA